MALVGCSEDAYEFRVTANFGPDVEVSFEGDRLEPGETLSRSYPTYVDAKYDLVILDVEWPTGHTTVGTNPWALYWGEGVAPEEDPPMCAAIVDIDPALTPAYKISSALQLGARQVARDVLLVRFERAAADLHQLGVAPELLDAILGAVAVAAEHLDRGIGDFLRRRSTRTASRRRCRAGCAASGRWSRRRCRSSARIASTFAKLSPM